MDFADRRGGHGVEPDQRAGGHHDLTAILLRKFNKVFVVQKRARAQDDRGPSTPYERRND
jgi:hypothetical protein